MYFTAAHSANTVTSHFLIFYYEIEILWWLKCLASLNNISKWRCMMWGAYLKPITFRVNSEKLLLVSMNLGRNPPPGTKPLLLGLQTSMRCWKGIYVLRYTQAFLKFEISALLFAALLESMNCHILKEHATPPGSESTPVHSDWLHLCIGFFWLLYFPIILQVKW